jgi:CRP-like cAMP-binding protein
LPGDAVNLSKIAILRKHDLFYDLSDAAIHQLAAHARNLSYRAGDPIFWKGEEGHGLLAVLSGVVRISASSDDSREIVLNLIGKNEIFGEIALLDGGPRTANATALTDCILLSIDHRDFVRVLVQEPALAVGVLAVVCKRLRSTTKQVEEMNFSSLHARLAKILITMADIQGTITMVEPSLEITQKEIGNMLGISRESINRHLREWESAGLIILKKGGCTIKHPGRLARLARGSAE